jgi:hypothetical protein
VILPATAARELSDELKPLKEDADKWRREREWTPIREYLWAEA